MATTSVTAESPVGKEPGGNEIDAKNYVTYRGEASKHLFTGPIEKYKNVLAELGLKDVDKDAKAKSEGIRLAQGSGFIYISVELETGARLSLVCDPAKIGSAIKGLGGKAVYGKKISRAYIPKKRIIRL